MNKTLTTPIGTAYYPRIDTPDTKFNSDGVYSCKLHLDEGQFNTFKMQVDSLVKQAYEEMCREKNKPSLRVADTSPVRVKDGNFEVYAKQVARKDTRKGLLEFRVTVFDAKGQRLEDIPPIGSGSRLKLAVEVYPYYTDLNGFGYSLRLKAVQIVELVEYGSSSNPANFGFGEEDGFVGEGESLNSAFTDEPSLSTVSTPSF